MTDEVVLTATRRGRGGAQLAASDRAGRSAADVQDVPGDLHSEDRDPGVRQEGDRREADRSAGPRRRRSARATSASASSIAASWRRRRRSRWPSTTWSARSITSSTGRRRWSRAGSGRQEAPSGRRSRPSGCSTVPATIGVDSQRRHARAEGRRRHRDPGRHRPLVHEDRRSHHLPDGADRSRQGDAARRTRRRRRPTCRSRLADIADLGLRTAD